MQILAGLVVLWIPADAVCVGLAWVRFQRLVAGGAPMGFVGSRGRLSGRGVGCRVAG